MQNGEQLTISLIGKQRQTIMGVAILGILLFHSRGVVAGSTAVRYAFAGAKYFLQIGVDIFLLLSGLGCGHSLARGGKENHCGHSVIQFWGRRLKRILPKYILITVLYCVISALTSESFNWKNAVEDYSLVTFFTKGNLKEWFIAGILLLYFLTPFFYWLLNVNRTAYRILEGLIVFFALAVSFSGAQSSFKIVNEIFIARIPVYMTGISFSRELESAKPVLHRRTALLLLAAFLACYLANRMFNTTNEMCVERLLFWPTAVVLSLLLANEFEKGRIPGSAFFGFFGTITLELYMTHEKILGFFRWSDQYPLWYAWLFDAAAILIAIGVSLLIHWLFTLLERRRLAL